MEFEGQAIACHHGGYVDASRLAEVAQASFEDFLSSPEGETRLEMIAYCVENEPNLICEYRPSACVHRSGSDDANTVALLWVHHTVAAEFLAWCRASALCDWFQEERCERYWGDEICSMWSAVAKKVESEIERLKILDPQTNSHLVTLRNHLDELLQQIEAERIKNLSEVDVAFPLGRISAELTVEIAKVFAEKANVIGT